MTNGNAMTNLVRVAIILVTMVWGRAALAQAWVQIEARPNEAQGLERASDYAGRLPDVNGFRLNSGWFAVALGPYSETEALETLRRLRAVRAIPSDSFIADGANFRERFFGDDVAMPAPGVPAEPLPPLEPGEETLAEARAGERSLTRGDREEIQQALKWQGFYNSIIDAAFGPGTRRAMAAWQEAQRYEPTGVLTTLQRRELLGTYREAQSSLDLTPVDDAQAGIEITLPLGVVAFDRYEPPFAHYEPVDGGAEKVVLISQSGDEITLAALYDIMQTLAVVPETGERNLGRSEFTLTGANDEVLSHTFARVTGGAVKGFTLIWPVEDEGRFRLALAAMQESFRANSGVLPDTIGDGAEQNIDLLAGLEIRRPERSRSGFFVSDDGAVLTTAEAVRQCRRITLNGDIEAEVTAEDSGLGVAMLRPRQTLAPLSVARLAVSEPRLQSDIAISGYPFGGALPAPTLTYGTMADVKGLDGDQRVQRLEVSHSEGDAGGPVFDATGSVAGMLLTREDGARQLPETVGIAADSPFLAEFLSLNGVSAAASDGADPMAPEDLTLLAADMTVLVSCWN